MEIVLLGLSALVGIGSLVCWIITLIKIFGDSENGGVGKGIFGLICGLYALIWAWQNKERHGIQKLVTIWSALIGIGVVLNIATRAMMS